MGDGSSCRSWQRLQNGARCLWTTRLSLDHLISTPHHIPAPPIPHKLGPHVRQPRLPPCLVQNFLVLAQKYFFGGKKIVTSNRCEFDLYPPRGITMGMRGEWELRERNDSRKHSRSHPQELWGRTPLSQGVRQTLHVAKNYFFLNTKN